MTMRFGALVAAALLLITGSFATARQAAAPAPAPPSSLDPYARAAIDILTGVVRGQLQGGNTAAGEITYFRHFEMQVQTGRNAYRAVHLHQGTVINPRGGSLASGQRVDVSGVAQPDGSLAANVVTIDQ